MNLNGTVNDVQRHARRNHLDHRNFLTGNLIADGVHHVCRLQRHQPCLLNLDATAGNILADGIKAGQRLAKGFTGIGALAHQFQCPLGNANGAHTVVNPARPEAALGDLETTALTQQQVLHRHPHVLVMDFSVAVRCMVIAEHRQRTNHLHARGIQRHQNH